MTPKLRSRSGQAALLLVLFCFKSGAALRSHPPTVGKASLNRAQPPKLQSPDGVLEVSVLSPYAQRVGEALVVNAQDKLVLKAPSFWEAPTRDDGPANVTYSWRLARQLDANADGHVPDASSLLSSSGRCLLSLPSHPNLVIDGGCLQTGARYVFSLDDDSKAMGARFGEVHIHVNSPPSRGIFHVSPEKGVALTTDFLLSHEGWMDVEGDLPISYVHHLLISETGPGRSLLLGVRSTETSTVTTLPASSNATITATVYDSLGASASASIRDVVIAGHGAPSSEGLLIQLGSLEGMAPLLPLEFSAHAVVLHEATRRLQLRRSKRRATEAGRVAEEEWSDEEDELRILLQATADLAASMPTEDADGAVSQAMSLAVTLHGLTSLKLTASTQGLAIHAVTSVLSAVEECDHARLDGQHLAPVLLSSLSNIVASGALSPTSTQPSGLKLKADHCSPAVSETLSTAVERVFRLLLPGMAEGERPAVLKTDMLTLSVDKRDLASTVLHRDRRLLSSVSQSEASTSRLLTLHPSLISSVAPDASSVAVKTVVWSVNNHWCSSRGRPTGTSSNIATDSAVGKVVSVDIYLPNGTPLPPSTLSNLPSPVTVTIPLSTLPPSTAFKSHKFTKCPPGVPKNFTVECGGSTQEVPIRAIAQCDGKSMVASYACPPLLVCGFYDEGLGLWDTKGCTTMAIGPDAVSCECSHLTDFMLFDAPLRQIKNTYREGTRNIVRRWQRSVTIVIVLGLICSIFFWSMLRRQWTQERDKFYLVESIRATPFYWDVIDRFEANMSNTHGGTHTHGTTGTTRTISKRSQGSRRDVESTRSSRAGMRGVSSRGDRGSSESGDGIPHPGRPSGGGRPGGHRAFAESSAAHFRTQRHPTANTLTVRGSVETWSTKDLAMDAMTKGKHRLLSLIDGMGSHWWSARTGRVEDELVVTKNVTRLSIHQKTLAFIIETLTLFTLCTILRNNALSVSRVAAKIDDSDWQGLVTTLAPALKNGVISMPVTLTVTLVLMHMNKKSRLTKGAREDVIERQRGYTQFREWKRGPPELYVPGLRLSVLQLKLIKVVLTHDMKSVEPASADAIVLHKQLKSADKEVAMLQAQLALAAKRIREQPDSFGITTTECSSQTFSIGKTQSMSSAAAKATKRLISTVTKRLKRYGFTARIYKWFTSLSMDIMANLSPSFWGNPMEFFDKELKAARLLDDFMLQKLWSSWRLIEFSFYELLVANRSTLTDITGTKWDEFLCDVGLSVYLLLCATWVFLFGVGVGTKEAGLITFSFIATMVANALVVSPTMGWIRLWITVRIGRRIQGDLRRCEGDFVDYCEDNIEIKSRGRSDSSGSSDEEGERLDEDDEAAFVSGLEGTARALQPSGPPTGGRRSSKVVAESSVAAAQRNALPRPSAVTPAGIQSRLPMPPSPKMQSAASPRSADKRGSVQPVHPAGKVQASKGRGRHESEDGSDEENEDGNEDGNESQSDQEGSASQEYEQSMRGGRPRAASEENGTDDGQTEEEEGDEGDEDEEGEAEDDEEQRYSNTLGRAPQRGSRR